MSMVRTYLSKDKLSLYDTKLKAKMSNDDASTLTSAKSYTDEELNSFAIKIDESLLPSVTTNNNGDFLRVVNGAWVASTVPNAEEASF